MPDLGLRPTNHYNILCNFSQQFLSASVNVVDSYVCVAGRRFDPEPYEALTVTLVKLQGQGPKDSKNG